ncbi:MAG: class I SAM-dependent methyltransferase [Bacteroidota bacterium]
MVSWLNNRAPVNGVFRISSGDKFAGSGKLYLEVRKREGRLYTDEEVRSLPKISTASRYHSEWHIRGYSARKIIQYLSKKKHLSNILELGCGNGWFANQLTKIPGCNVAAMDVNLYELEQGARVFSSNDRLNFIYADIFEMKNTDAKFDAIILASSIQYFPEVKNLLNLLLQFCAAEGEIHIIDSPFYSASELLNAKQRTEKYYRDLGFPEMSRYYHHHTHDELSGFKVSKLYNPASFYNRISGSVLHLPLSPFPWLKITAR